MIYRYCPKCRVVNNLTLLVCELCSGHLVDKDLCDCSDCLDSERPCTYDCSSEDPCEGCSDSIQAGMEAQHAWMVSIGRV